MPTKLEAAWQVIRRANETRIDLPMVEFGAVESRERRFFAQLAGAGLDARAIELVSWWLKKKIGPAAYVVAGLKALGSKLPRIKVSAGAEQASGELVLIGNGRFYGGLFKVFPQGNMQDGLLEVCVFPRVSWWTLLRLGPRLLLRGTLPNRATQIIRAESVTLTSETRAGLQVDGELAGWLPGTFTIRRNGLRVIVP